jgi:uncharacterized protein
MIVECPGEIIAVDYIWHISGIRRRAAPMKRVLSIDGGGIRGIIPAVICAKLEEWSVAPLSSQFDLIAGTSTGGILAMGLSLPPNGKPAKELVSFYKENGRKIFSFPKPSVGQWTGPKYSNTKLKRAADQVFGSTKMSQAVV